MSAVFLPGDGEALDLLQDGIYQVKAGCIFPLSSSAVCFSHMHDTSPTDENGFFLVASNDNAQQSPDSSVAIIRSDPLVVNDVHCQVSFYFQLSRDDDTLLCQVSENNGE